MKAVFWAWADMHTNDIKVYLALARARLGRKRFKCEKLSSYLSRAYSVHWSFTDES